MCSPIRIAPLVVAVGLLASAGATADVITLADGSKILGTVERLADGKLTLATKFAGTLEIDAAQIVSIAVDRPVNVGMESGDRLVGPIEWKPALDRAVVQTEMGGVPISVDRVSAIWPKDAKSPEEVAYEEQLAQVQAEAEAARAKWSATLEVGLLFKDGNSDVLNARGRAEARRTSDRDLLKFYVSGEYAEENEKRSASEVKGGAYYEHMLTKHWFAYVRGELEYDEFEDLDLRLSTGPGLGYYWIKKPEHELKTRAGIGYLHESYMNGRTVDTAEGEVGLDWRLDITPWLRFTTANAWYPTFEELGDYRLVSDSAFVFPIGASDAWKLKLGALYEYKARPAGGRERLDQTYYANIVLDLK